MRIVKASGQVAMSQENWVKSMMFMFKGNHVFYKCWLMAWIKYITTKQNCTLTLKTKSSKIPFCWKYSCKVIWNIKDRFDSRRGRRMSANKKINIFQHQLLYLSSTSNIIENNRQCKSDQPIFCKTVISVSSSVSYRFCTLQIIYTAFNEDFRKAFVKILSKCCK